MCGAARREKALVKLDECAVADLWWWRLVHCRVGATRRLQDDFIDSCIPIEVVGDTQDWRLTIYVVGNTGGVAVVSRDRLGPRRTMSSCCEVSAQPFQNRDKVWGVNGEG